MTAKTKIVILNGVAVACLILAMFVVGFSTAAKIADGRGQTMSTAGTRP